MRLGLGLRIESVGVWGGIISRALEWGWLDIVVCVSAVVIFVVSDVVVVVGSICVGTEAGWARLILE